MSATYWVWREPVSVAQGLALGLPLVVNLFTPSGAVPGHFLATTSSASQR